MKKLIPIFFLVSFICNSQIDAKIEFKNGTQLRGMFKSKGNKLQSIDDKQKYHINDMIKDKSHLFQ